MKNMNKKYKLTYYREAPTIMSRGGVTQPLLTEYAVIDALVPVSLSQRQLLVDDKGTGKSTLAVNILINQKRANRYFSPEGRGRDKVFCYYVSIGLRLHKTCKLANIVDENHC